MANSNVQRATWRLQKALERDNNPDWWHVPIRREDLELVMSDAARNRLLANGYQSGHAAGQRGKQDEIAAWLRQRAKMMRVRADKAAVDCPQLANSIRHQALAMDKAAAAIERGDK